jgi:hypothetical protein
LIVSLRYFCHIERRLSQGTSQHWMPKLIWKVSNFLFTILHISHTEFQYQFKKKLFSSTRFAFVSFSWQCLNRNG